MSSCQNLLPGFFSSCVHGEQLPFCSPVCRFSAQLHHFHSWRPNPHSHPSVQPICPSSSLKRRDCFAALCGDHFWEKLFGFPSAFTKIQMRYLLYLTSAFHMDQTSNSKISLALLNAEISLVHLLSSWLVESFSQKKISPRIFYRLKTSLLLPSSAEKMCNLKLWACIFVFAKVVRAACLQLLGRCLILHVLSIKSVFPLSDSNALPWIFAYEKRNRREIAGLEILESGDFEHEWSTCAFSSSECKDAPAPRWEPFHKGSREEDCCLLYRISHFLTGYQKSYEAVLIFTVS